MIFLIKKPIISEKSMQLSKSGLYTFLVDKSARKEAIAQAIETRYKVSVVAVKTINIKSLIKVAQSRKGARVYLKTPKLKKALVQVKSGQKITEFNTEKEAVVKTAETVEKETTVKEKKSLRGTKVRVERQGSRVEGEGDSQTQKISKKGKI